MIPCIDTDFDGHPLCQTLDRLFVWIETDEGMRAQVERHWSSLRFGALDVQTANVHRRFTVQVFLDELNPDFVAVALFAAFLLGMVAGSGMEIIVRSEWD